MVKQDELRNKLKQTRIRLGMSQQDLANLANVTRQTISGVESGQYAPSTTIALRLAKALGCQVEDLFWLEQDLPEIAATPAYNVPLGQRLRLILAQVGNQWIAHPLIGQNAFRTEMIPADGEGDRLPGTNTMVVKLLDDPGNLHQTVILAGCAPALSLWARAAERWHPNLRVHWTLDNSMTALHRLRRGEVHFAGMHLYDPHTGEYNTPFVRSVLKDTAVVLINLGVWEEGMLTGPNNPLGLKTIADLAQTGVTIVNRETGSGSRQVLERSLQNASIPFTAIKGFDQIVNGHLEVAQAVATGRVTSGISTASVATAFGLGFIPLQQSRYDLAVLKSYLDEAPVQKLLGTLGHRRVLSQLEAIGGYNTSQTGEVVATIEPQ
ncbi:substrate-binding domain-containing protein [Nodularia spumigena CS-586/05]|uniref:substrate-binding domain-containing protein n=1 Tax=Cyanophyceae TaxID=3028117 RepID=UPI0023304953|nr:MULTISPECIES: substrate-binding domain-containing protein [Cyanophyceae]MDB9321838.1 substrate-binding domain-containing protein [Nodularia spumigena CS-591/07A]MDB9343909.1 substrate-binding domain-containing protein [Nodularia spumigena CS-588/06]MDB9360864.1 substrate-binding domain-containing protein [Nodularia spumigena CS-588/02]MDB9366463.1 substrate-binding domain-containing protein [Nodularia spumigena CS-588/02A10]MDB9371736.1 substrate-binding domain-containing protein [Nodularia